MLRLGEQVRASGIPLVVTDASGRVTSYDNLPFDASLYQASVAQASSCPRPIDSRISSVSFVSASRFDPSIR